MNDEPSNGEPAEKPRLPIDEVAGLWSVNPWTVRMWVDRFGTLEHSCDADGNLLLSPRAAELIGVICRLIKKRMSLDDVRKYLESNTI